MPASRRPPRRHTEGPGRKPGALFRGVAQWPCAHSSRHVGALRRAWANLVVACIGDHRDLSRNSAACAHMGGAVFARIACPYGLPHPGRSTHPSSSCTICTAPTCWRHETAHRRRQGARRDRRSGRSRSGRAADSQDTSPRARHARRAGHGRSAAASPACCTGRCAGCGWTGGRARCSDYPRDW